MVHTDKEAMTAVNKLIHVDNVEVILGGLFSSETIQAGKITQQNEIVMVSALSSSPEIYHTNDNCLLICPRNILE